MPHPVGRLAGQVVVLASMVHSRPSHLVERMETVSRSGQLLVVVVGLPRLVLEVVAAALDNAQ